MGTFNCSSQKTDVDFLNATIAEFKLAVDENKLHETVELLSQNSLPIQQNELQIIEKVFLADLISQKVDSLNPKSTDLYLQASHQIEASKNVPLQIWVHTQTGFYLYSYNQYIKALPFFLKSARALEQVADEELFDVADILRKNAYFFSTTFEHDKSIKFLNRALKQTSVQSKKYSDLLNAIGICYFNKGMLEKADEFFKKTEKSALQCNNMIRYAKALGDLARVQIEKKNWNNAETLLLEDIAISEKTGNDRNTMFARVQLGKMYWKKGDIPNSYNTLTQAQHYAASKTYLKGYEQEAVETLLKIAILQNNSKAELNLRRKLDTLNVIVKQNEGKEAINRVALEIQKEKVQWQLEAEEEKLKKASLLQWTWTIVSILLAVIAVLIYRSYKRRLKLQMAEFNQKLLSFQYEKIQSEKKLAETHNSVEAYKTYLIEKTQQVKRLEEVISNIKNQSQNTANKKTNALEQLLSSHLMTDENWNLFKQAFIAEQPDYYNELLDSLPDVTESNLRIILLQRMGLNNQEIAGILGVTIDAVKKAKQRLRKKYKNTADFFI